MNSLNKVILIFFFFLLSNENYAQRKNGFIIKGKLNGLKNGTLLHLVCIKENGGVDTLMSRKAKNEGFVFKGKVPLEGQAYFIKIDTIHTKYTIPFKGYITILMENKRINVLGNLNDLSVQTVSVKGSMVQDEYIQYLRFQNQALDIVNGYLQRRNEAWAKKKPSDTIALYQEKFDQSLQEYKKVKIDWINKHRNLLITPWVIQTTISEVHNLQKVYDLLAEKVKNSYYGVKLKKHIELVKNTDIGATAPDFRLPTSEGKLLSLKEVVQKGKLTLIDFWASWCAPCRGSFPKLKELYALYHPKGFNIFGFSTDENETSWQTALEKDQLPWYNIRQQKENLARKLYGVEKLPSTFLLNSEGKIIAKDLSTKGLEEKLNEFLQETKAPRWIEGNSGAYNKK